MTVEKKRDDKTRYLEVLRLLSMVRRGTFLYVSFYIYVCHFYIDNLVGLGKTSSWTETNPFNELP